MKLLICPTQGENSYRKFQEFKEGINYVPIQQKNTNYISRKLFLPF